MLKTQKGVCAICENPEMTDKKIKQVISSFFILYMIELDY